MRIGTNNGWAIAATVLTSIVYFSIIIVVLLSPVKKLAPLEHKVATGKGEKVPSGSPMGSCKYNFVEIYVRSDFW